MWSVSLIVCLFLFLAKGSASKLCPYGTDVGDTELPTGKSILSPIIVPTSPIPFGGRIFNSIRVSSNGYLALGPGFANFPWPPQTICPGLTVGIVAPYWNHWDSSLDPNGGIFYQEYESLVDMNAEGSGIGDDNIDPILTRLRIYFDIVFIPTYAFKATWVNVRPALDPLLFSSSLPSTFQVILLTDGKCTYVMYKYKERSLIALPSPLFSKVLIGYTNSFAASCYKWVESRGDRNPFTHAQTSGGKIGTFVYNLNKYYCDPKICKPDENTTCADPLFPFGVGVGDKKISRSISKVYRLPHPYAIPFGERLYRHIWITVEGVMYLGSNYFPIWAFTFLGFPSPAGLPAYLPLIAPFRDEFKLGYGGRVFYQVYDKKRTSLGPLGKEICNAVSCRVKAKYGVESFEPQLVIVVTWSKVIRRYFVPWHYYYKYCPFTFQMVLATDYCNTYVLFNYGDFTWWWFFSWHRFGTIGYSNGLSPVSPFHEAIGDYRPNTHAQSGGSAIGSYLYHLTSYENAVKTARCACVKWYCKDIQKPWVPPVIPCPIDYFQARRDCRFIRSVDNFFPLVGLSTEPWAIKRGSKRPVCFQRRTFSHVMSGPRCCYFPRLRVRRIRWRIFYFYVGRLITSPYYYFSYHEKKQVSSLAVRLRWLGIFGFDINTKYQNYLDYDVLPRCQCVFQSNSFYHAWMYRKRRPIATSVGYSRRRFAWFWGDPHFMTLDQASYTFNGIGEYYYIYAPSSFTLQGRFQPFLKDDGTLSGATGVTAVAAQDITGSSPKVQFEVDNSGSGVIVKVDGVEVQNNLTGDASFFGGTTELSVENGTYTATFPSFHVVSVSASVGILRLLFVPFEGSLMNSTKGLLGTWNGNLRDDFEMRDGTVLNYDSLLVTTDVDILGGSISHRNVFPFGQSWRVMSNESCFNYTGGNDSYSAYNPIRNVTEPPFLEDLVRNQRNTTRFMDVVANCTNSNGQLLLQCLYDVLVACRSDIGVETAIEAEAIGETNAINDNTPARIELNETSPNFMDGFFQVRVGALFILHFIVYDADGDKVTFSSDNSTTVSGITFDNTAYAMNWTPSSQDSNPNGHLECIATESGDFNFWIIVPIKICYCLHGGTCLYDVILNSSPTFQIVGCLCPDAYSGDFCQNDANGCLSPGCFLPNDCTDVPAPGTGATCAPCPPGTTGDGYNCTGINFCEPNPCEQNCQSLFNGTRCTCLSGFLINGTDPSRCDDVDECNGTNGICQDNEICMNTPGSFICTCPDPFIYISGLCIENHLRLICGEKTMISLSDEEKVMLHLEMDDYVVISQSEVTNVSTLSPKCVAPATAPCFSIHLSECDPIYKNVDDALYVTHVIRTVAHINPSIPIQRYVTGCLNRTCHYNTTELVSTGDIQAQISKIRSRFEASGSFTVDLRFYANSSYNDQLPESGATVMVPKYIFVKATLLKLDPNKDIFILQAHQCWATHNANPTDSKMYPIIMAGCPANNAYDAAGTIVINENYKSNCVSFKFKSFIWSNLAELEQTIYVHCFVMICNNNTGTGCPEKHCTGTRRRAVLEGESHKIITSGPIYMLPREQDTCSKDNGGCSDICISDASGRYCSCYGDRTLSEDGKSCFDTESDAIVTDVEEESDQTMILLAVFAAIAVVAAAVSMFYYTKSIK